MFSRTPWVVRRVSLWSFGAMVLLAELPAAAQAADTDNDGVADAIDSCPLLPNPAQAERQWATGVVGYSTQYTAAAWAAQQATGAPNVMSCSDNPNAWSPLTFGPASEWIELSYATPVHAVGVRVHETYLGGFVASVDLVEPDGTRHNAYWTGADVTPCPDWLVLEWPETPFLVASVRLNTLVVGGEQIDAVGLYAIGACGAVDAGTSTGVDAGAADAGPPDAGATVADGGAGVVIVPAPDGDGDSDGFSNVLDDCPAWPDPAQAGRQWAAAAVAWSTQYTSTDWSTLQATGEPDVAACGDNLHAWSPLMFTIAPEWIELGFALPERSTGVRIHETYFGGFVAAVDLVEPDGTRHDSFWTGMDPTPCGGWLVLTWPETTFAVAAVRIHTVLMGGEQIDAVGLYRSVTCMGDGGVLPPDAGTVDAAVVDAAMVDAAMVDAAMVDAAMPDAAAVVDGGVTAVDAGVVDSGVMVGVDAAMVDAAALPDAALQADAALTGSDGAVASPDSGEADAAAQPPAGGDSDSGSSSGCGCDSANTPWPAPLGLALLVPLLRRRARKAVLLSE